MLLPALAGTAAVGALCAAGYQSMAPTGQWYGHTFTGLARGTKKLALTYDDGPNNAHTQNCSTFLPNTMCTPLFFSLAVTFAKLPSSRAKS